MFIPENMDKDAEKNYDSRGYAVKLLVHKLLGIFSSKVHSHYAVWMVGTVEDQGHSGLAWSGFKTSFCCLLVAWSSGSYFVPLCLSILTWKMRIMTLHSLWDDTNHTICDLFLSYCSFSQYGFCSINLAWKKRQISSTNQIFPHSVCPLCLTGGLSMSPLGSHWNWK